jgi:hypothetical protein
VTGKAKIRVAYGFRADLGSYVGPKNGSPIDESDILFHVGGTNLQSWLTSSVNLGPSATVYANVYAPNGTTWLQANTKATGAFLGKDILVGLATQVTLGTAFTGLARPDAGGWNRAPGEGAESAEIPQTVVLNQNFPNPFNPTTQIRYGLPHQGHVLLTIHNVLGQEVARVVDEVQTEGFHEVRWNGTNHDGLTVGSGVYFYRLQADGLSENRRMMLLK